MLHHLQFHLRCFVTVSVIAASACGGDDEVGETADTNANANANGNDNANDNGNANDNSNDNEQSMGVPGCIDDDAANFESDATEDDGSCLYAVQFVSDLTDADAMTQARGVTLRVRAEGETAFNETTLVSSAGIFSATLDLSPGDYAYQLRIGADGESTGVESFTVVDAPLVVDDGVFVAVNGCTDANAKNTSATATMDDGSCRYDLSFTVDMGCPDATDGDGTPVGEVTGFSAVGLAGSSGIELALTGPDASGIWSATAADVNLPTPSFEYFYFTDTRSSVELLSDDASCGLGLTPEGSRVVSPVSGETYRDVYGQCTACPSPANSIVVSESASGSDGNVLDNGSVSDVGAVIAKVGYFGSTGPKSTFVFAFRLPGTLRQDDEVVAANLRLQLLNRVGTVSFGADLYGLGTRSAPELTPADVTGGTLIESQFFVSTLPDSALVTTSAAAEPSLVGFLNDQLASGAAPGDHVFFRLEPSGANPAVGEAIYQVNASEQSGDEAKPLLEFTAECDACELFERLGCPDEAALNYDDLATVDDGSCVFPPTEYPIVVSDYFAPTADFGSPFGVATCPERVSMARGECYGFDWDGVGPFSGTNFETVYGDVLPIPTGARQVSFVAWSPDVGAGATAARFFVVAPSGNEITTGFLEPLQTAPVQRTILSINNDPNEIVMGFGWAMESSRGVNGPIYIDDIVWESPEFLEVGIFPLPERTLGVTDSDVEVDSGAGIYEDPVSPSLLRVGRRDGVAMSVVLPLAIPDTGGAPFTSADIDVTVRDAINPEGTPFDFNVSLYGLPFRTTDTVIAADYDAPATLIQADLLTPASTAFTDYALNGSGRGALLAYLNQQVNDGAVPGDFVFLRLSPEPIGAGAWPADDTLQWWFVWGLEALEPPVEAPFTIRFDTR